jgi:hypothetical protein
MIIDKAYLSLIKIIIKKPCFNNYYNYYNFDGTIISQERASEKIKCSKETSFLYFS